MDKAALLIEMRKIGVFHKIISKAAEENPEKYQALFADAELQAELDDIRKGLVSMTKAVLPAGNPCARCNGSGTEPA